MYPSESEIDMSSEQLEAFAKEAKLALEILNETLLGLQSRLTYNEQNVKNADIVQMTYTLCFMLKGVLERGNGIFLY
jgi:hypothetical protein